MTQCTSPFNNSNTNTRAIRKLHAEDPRRRIYLTGFSLGGNVILKALGELGDEAARLGVEGAAVSCVPFDAVRSSSKIDTGFNRLVYAANFLKTLKVKAARKHAQHAGEDGRGPYDLERVMACTKIGDFDDECVRFCFWVFACDVGGLGPYPACFPIATPTH